MRLRICASRSDSAFPAPTSTFLNHEPSRWRGRLLKCWPTSCSTWKLLKGVHSQDTPAAGSPITRGNCAHPLALQVANGNCLQADSGGCPPKAEHWCLVNCEPAGGSTDFPVRRSTAHVSYVAPQLQGGRYRSAEPVRDVQAGGQRFFSCCCCRMLGCIDGSAPPSTAW